MEFDYESAASIRQGRSVSETGSPPLPVGGSIAGSGIDTAHLTPTTLDMGQQQHARRFTCLVFAVRFVGLPVVPQNFQRYEPTAERFLLPTSAHARH